MNYLMIVGLAEIAIGMGLLSDKKNSKSKVTRILSIINIVLGAILIGWGFFY